MCFLPAAHNNNNPRVNRRNENNTFKPSWNNSKSRSPLMATSFLTKLPKPERLSRFVDAVRVQFRGGRGADGCISMLSLFANEFAGPDGGNGGCGGHVVLVANHKIKSLCGVARAYQGQPGHRGMGKSMHGSNAEHTFVQVPIGTLVTPAKPKELAEHEFDPDASEVVADLDQDGSMFIAARGGAGGRGNASYLSNKNRHPAVAEAGAMGELNVYHLRMRYYAHVGLIGLPNVGKSTLLNRLTGANVKIGNYAFTTRCPQVGVIEYQDDYTQLAISDLPGLIDESSKNRGLGLQFLRSVKRCACLLYVIDISLPEPHRQLETLFKELESFKLGLSKRPNLILANKIDELEAGSANLDILTDYLRKHRPKSKILPVSTLRGDNLEEVKLELRRMYDQYLAKNDDDFSEALIW